MRADLDDGGHDAQRRLERQALRNVRALVDKLEGEPRDDGTARFLALVLVFVVIIVAAALLAQVLHETPQWAPLVIQRAEPAAPGTPSPRSSFAGARAPEPKFENYLKAYVSRLEKSAASAYPARIADTYRSVQVTAAIRSDGSLASVEVIRKSGSEAVDAATVDLVRAAAPYEPFSAYGLEDVDVLHITRTFKWREPKKNGR